MRLPPTPRHAQVLQAIRRLTVDGVPPTLAELAPAVGSASKSSIHNVLTEMKARGLITWTPQRRRSIEIVDQGGADIGQLLADVELALLQALNRYDSCDQARAGAGPIPLVDQAREKAAEVLQRVAKAREALP